MISRNSLVIAGLGYVIASLGYVIASLGYVIAGHDPQSRVSVALDPGCWNPGPDPGPG